MSKGKSKRKRRRDRRPNVPAATVKKTVVVGTRRSAVEFNPDYSYVIKDLKRIAVLAGGFTALLVILSFFLR